LIWKGAGRPEDHYIIPPVFIGGARARAAAPDSQRGFIQAQPGWQQLAGLLLSCRRVPQQLLHAVGGSQTALLLLLLLLPPAPHAPHDAHTRTPCAALDAYVFLRDNKAFEDETVRCLCVVDA
jgi:hypothetical protein